MTQNKTDYKASLFWRVLPVLMPPQQRREINHYSTLRQPQDNTAALEALETLEAFDLAVTSWAVRRSTGGKIDTREKSFFGVVDAWRELPILNAIQTIREALEGK